MRRVQLLCSDMDPSDNNGQGPRRLQLVCPPDLTVDSLRALFQTHVTVRSCPLDSYTGCHTQVDFIHCLVPDLLEITNCSFYWGKFLKKLTILRSLVLDKCRISQSNREIFLSNCTETFRHKFYSFSSSLRY